MIKPAKNPESNALEGLTDGDLDQVTGGEGESAIVSEPLPGGGVQIDWAPQNQHLPVGPDHVWEPTGGNGGWGIG